MIQQKEPINKPMSDVQLAAQFNDFIRRCETANVVMCEDDGLMIKGVMTKLIVAPTSQKAETIRDFLVNGLSTNLMSPDHHKYILVDENLMVASDGHRMVITDNDGLEPGVYTSKFEKVPHEGDLNLSTYVEQLPDVYENIMTVTESDCNVGVKKGEGNRPTFKYVDVKGKLRFHVEHFMQFTNGEKQFTIQYNNADESKPCQIINPKFPDLVLIIVNLVM